MPAPREIDVNDRDYFMRKLSAMRSERSSFISHYQELSQFVQPRRGRFLVTDRNKGDKRYQSIINSRATQAHRTARSGMLAGSMSPARPWFALATPDPDMMEFGPVKAWLWKVELLMRAIFNGSNLYNMAPVMLGEMSLFATGCMTHVDDFDSVARFYTHTAGSYMIGQNDKFEVDTIAREFEFTVDQMMGQFGYENCSRSVRNAYDNGNYGSWFPVNHFIEPNPRADKRSPLSSSKPFRSVYFEPGNSADEKKKFLEMKGFDEFPAYVPRWDVTGEDIYGTDCPAMTALGDVKGLQIEEKRKAQGLDKTVNPALKGPASLMNKPVSSLPGGLTIYDNDGSKEGLSAIYEVRLDIAALMADIRGVEQRIDEAFFVPLFKPITEMRGIQPKNERELIERNQEALLLIGPVLERLHGEFLTKMIDRTFNQCVRAGLLPPAPPELQGRPLKVEYISTLAQAQRAVATNGIERLTGYIAGLVEAGLSDGKKFDGDQAIDEYAAVIGVPPRLVVPDEVVAQRRAEEQKQQKMAQMAELAQSAANTVKMASDAKISEPSALTALAGGGGR